MQAFGGGSVPRVIVDYAHTPDALKQALMAVREHCSGQLWCVFGCGGDRDRGKRAEMGRIAERYSDHVILTSDNPRNETPKRIIDDIKRGMLSQFTVASELDRGKAIAKAISLAEPEDVVLVAGKGHERFQLIKGEKIPFLDSKCVERCLGLENK